MNVISTGSSSASLSDDGGTSDSSSMASEGNGGKPTKAFTTHKSKLGGTSTSQYRDFSHVSPGNDNIHGLVTVKRTLPETEVTFPVKLYQILSCGKFDDIVCFLPHGRSWRIHNPEAFEHKVLPLFFRHGRFSSFMRQISGWGFTRVLTGPDYNSYYHELFLRGMPHLLSKMKRLTPADTKARKKLPQPVPPNFYELDRKKPLPMLQPISKDLPATAAASAPVSIIPPDTRNSTSKQATSKESLNNLHSQLMGSINHRMGQGLHQHHQQQQHAPSVPMGAPSGGLNEQQLLRFLVGSAAATAATTATQPMQNATPASALCQQLFNLLLGQQPMQAPALPTQPQVSNNDQTQLLLQLMLQQLQQSQQANSSNN